MDRLNPRKRMALTHIDPFRRTYEDGWNDGHAGKAFTPIPESMPDGGEGHVRDALWKLVEAVRTTRMYKAGYNHGKEYRQIQEEWT